MAHQYRCMKNSAGDVRVALVTGAARRVGRVIALHLAKNGWAAAVHFNKSRREALAAVREIQATGGTACPFHADLRRESDINRMVEKISRRFGRLDLAVNSAAIFHKTPFERATAGAWDDFISTNLRSVFLLSKAAAPLLKKSGGSIVNIADVGGLLAWKGYLPYCVSKAGVIAMTKCLAKELAPQARANCICPGPVLLPESYTTAQRRAAEKRTLLGRIGTPDEVARAVEFLANSASATGAVVVIDSGRSVL